MISSSRQMNSEQQSVIFIYILVDLIPPTVCESDVFIATERTLIQEQTKVKYN